jgi:CheY-like chemotaxis protein
MGRILIVDDDQEIRALHVNILRRGGFQVDAAADGAAAWAALTNHSYALLITDNQMPGMSGLDLVEKLRSACNSMPVILAASPLETKDVERCASLRLAATLHKPYPVAHFLETVKRIVHP